MEIQELIQSSKAPLRIWDIYVPIVTSKNVSHVYITEPIDEPSYYNELCFLLDNATEQDTINIHINTPGGIIDSAVMIINSIKNSKANVVGHLAGTVASAGTMIALSCNSLKVANHTTFMIHNYSSSGGRGKGHELKAMQAFVDANLNSTFTATYGGFLTPKEIREVIDGKDLWMGKDEVLSRFASKLETTLNSPSQEQVTPKRRGRPKAV